MDVEGFLNWNRRHHVTLVSVDSRSVVTRVGAKPPADGTDVHETEQQRSRDSIVGIATRPNECCA